jgi:hypothetical protein
MAGATYCLSCASLPAKNRPLAVKTSRCPECKTELGVTSYGATFRIPPTKRQWFLSPALYGGMMLGAGLFAFIIVLTGLGLWSSEKMIPLTPRVEAPPTDLKRIPEVAVADGFKPNVRPEDAKLKIRQLIEDMRQKNSGADKDAFVQFRMKQRPELRGLPFVMGDACRLDMAKAQSFQSSVQAVRDGMELDFRTGHQKEQSPFWDNYMAQTQGQGIDTEHGIAALSQILGPQRKSLRTEFMHKLKLSNRPEATRAIARAAIFDAESDVRNAALKALKDRPQSEYTDVLMHGIRYPLAIVAKRSAQALILLDRKDLLPQLAEVLDEPAPGDPETRGDDVVKVAFVREVVRINHHRNCLLCHPPSQTGSTEEVPGVIPIPGSPFPTSPREAYGSAKSTGEPMVRADTTYLRQDFSVMMPVENAAPWPEMQRFDFLVRSRELDAKELKALEAKVQARPAGYLSENHRAALLVLQKLTGQDAAPNTAAWQRVLGAAKADE